MLSAIEKLQKFLKLEVERNYDNRAVVGGLEKILPNWTNEANAQNVNPDLIQTVVERISKYQQMDVTTRAWAINELLTLIKNTQTTITLPDGSPTERLQIGVKPSELIENAISLPNQLVPTRGVSTSPSRVARNTNVHFGTDASSLGLNAPLTIIPGVGPRHAKTLAALGMNTLGDMLYYFPRRYDDYSQLKPINRIAYGEELSVLATIQNIENRQIRGGKSQITEAIVSDGSGYLRLTWFNQPWMANRLKPGQQVVLSGKVDMYLGRLVMNNPDCETLEQEHLHTNRIVPVYSLSGQITQRWLRRIMHQVVQYWAPRTPDFLPVEIKQSAELMDLPTALLQIHFPDNQELLQSARYRLAFDEIFLLQLGVLSQKRLWQTATAPIIPVTDDWLSKQIERLPFALTKAQQKALRDIQQDLQSGKPMNRLLQGDVGSGKTVVAMIAIAAVAQQGFQSAFMAPTSILAEQHYATLSRLLIDQHPHDAPLREDQIALLTGDIPEVEKQKIRAGLKSGQIKLVIGTHALLEDPVEFDHLQFIIVDEQHRFGVEQRATLRAKGKNPHLLVMTATPIPRSLALTVYGDLDLTIMDEIPAGRQPIETHVLHPVERERAYQLIRRQVQEGHQAFIIYPLIEQGEREEAKAAVEEHERLQKEVFPELKLALLHGRMRGEEKDQIMNSFRNKEFDILVSTSVVEVGVDIPNATVMLVEGANRFGLAQLHQFRGRVGRGSAKAYCLLIPETENALENERLAAMAETNDGFVLAERDLEQRGPGQFLGTQQSGFADLRMASLTDLRLIEKARKQAQSLFEKDPLLDDPKHQELKKMVMRLFETGKGDIS